MDAIVLQSQGVLHQSPSHDSPRSLPVAVPKTRPRLASQAFGQPDDWRNSLSQSIPISEDTELGSDVSRVRGARSARSSMATTPDNVASRPSLPQPQPNFSRPRRPRPGTHDTSAYISHSPDSAPDPLSWPAFNHSPQFFPPFPFAASGKAVAPRLSKLPQRSPPLPLQSSLPLRPLRHSPSYSVPSQNNARVLFGPPPPSSLPGATHDRHHRSIAETCHNSPGLYKGYATSTPIEVNAHSIPIPLTDATDDQDLPRTIQHLPGRLRGHEPGAGLSIRSLSNPSDTYESSSDSSEVDPFTYRNARTFPPVYPATSRLTSRDRSHRTAHTKKIASWVAERENPSGVWEILGDGARPKFRRNESSAEGSRTSVSAPLSPNPEDNVETLWTKLKEKRAEVDGIRSHMARTRRDMQVARRKKDDTDNDFMRLIRPLWINMRDTLGKFPDALERRLMEMQHLRTEYYSLEANYEELENRLDQEEDELGGLEINFFSLLASGHDKTDRHRPKRLDWKQEITTYKKPPILQGISPNGPPEDLHPMYIDLMSNVGALENAREELQDLLSTNQRYLDDIRLKEFTKMPWNLEEEEFFAEFPAEEERMKENVDSLQQEVERLRIECEEKGVMRKHMPAKTAYLLYPQNGYEDEDMELETPDSIAGTWNDRELSIFPLLRSQPGKAVVKAGAQTALGGLKAAVKLPNTDPEKARRLLLAKKEYAIDRLIFEGDRTSYIDRWLLQRLRLSSLEVMLLYVIFIGSQALKIRDQARWENDVLRYWWNDGASQSNFQRDASAGLESIGKDSIQGSRIGTPHPSRAVSEGVLDSEEWHKRGSPRDEARSASI